MLTLLALRMPRNLVARQFTFSLHLFSTKAVTRTDRLALSSSRYAALEVDLGSAGDGDLQLRPPPNLDDLLQRSDDGLHECFWARKLASFQ
jgi:hypothetical protein